MVRGAVSLQLSAVSLGRRTGGAVLYEPVTAAGVDVTL